MEDKRPFDNTLLVLGAGASAPLPTALPLFGELFGAVMRGMGWHSPDGKRWEHDRYGTFTAPDLSPEVLFGSLATDRVEFAEQVAKRISDGEPNAVHIVAAAVLRDGGCVWTTNMDGAVEQACGQAPVRAGRAWRRAPELLVGLDSAGPGVLVKFHGTVEAPKTLAFADRDLMTPLAEDDRSRLEAIAHGRVVIVYGYAAADADLADLFEGVFRVASTVRWFEPGNRTRDRIRRAFPSLGDVFDPPTVPEGDQWKEAIRLTTQAFLDHVDPFEVAISPELRRDLLVVEERPPETLKLRRSPQGVTNARLTERWGSPKEARRALWAARRGDLLHLRVASIPGHLRWVGSNSLYRGHVVSAVIRVVATRPRLLKLLPKSGWRDFVLTRHLALLLRDHDWRALDKFTAWTEQARPQLGLPASPVDSYYKAQASRYQLRPKVARADAEEAANGLSLLRDPERLAGAIYESGSAAIYQADFAAALRAAFDLRYRRGRYAIARWPAWGAWLEVVTRCHLDEPEAAGRVLEEDRGCQRFEEEGRQDALADLRTARLLLYRVQLAHGWDPDPGMLVAPEDAEREGRYRDDLDLLLADIAIAEGRRDEAAERLQRVAGDPSCTVAERWAALGRAELKRRASPVAAADEFASLAVDAHERRATWLELQAVIGLAACSDDRETAAWTLVREQLPQSLRRSSASQLAVGSPRVLWMLTV
ncbi:MAG: SIR2 family protein [Acidimicrobiales bacterium]|jgi:hypothetical protein